MENSIKWTTEDTRPSGIIASERRNLRSKNYNKVIRKAQRLNYKYRLSLLTVLNQPDLLIKTLSELSTVAPTIPRNFRTKGLFNQFEGKGNSKKLRHLVFYLNLMEDNWLTALIEERLIRILNSKYLRSKVLWETRMLYFLRKSLSLSQYKILIGQIYRSSTIADWKRLGAKILEKSSILFLEDSPIVKTERKRGYTDHGTIPSEKINIERLIYMSEEFRTTAEIKEDILKKQLLLFEQNLDNILELQTLGPETYRDHLTKNFQEAINLSKIEKKE